MQDLRLIGVHEDGAHLLLTDASGGRYRVALDESLRAAARRDRPRLGQLQIEIEGGARPRDVQAMIRAGFSADEVAERTGWTVEKVHRYEGPILAEREHVARLGRTVRLRHRGPATGVYGQPVAAQTLEERVLQRLGTRGVAPEQLSWDSWRRDGAEWAVVAVFAAGGRQRQATWGFDVPTRSLLARDDEARWLSEDEPTAPDAPRPPAPVYDVEADGGLQAPTGRHRQPARPADPVDLMAAMRERSGVRARRGSGRRRLEPVTLPLDDGPGGPDDASTPAADDAGELIGETLPTEESTHPSESEEPTDPAQHAGPVGRPDGPADQADTHEQGAPTNAEPPEPTHDEHPPVQDSDPVTRPRRERPRRGGGNQRAVGLAALFRSTTADRAEPDGATQPDETHGVGAAFGLTTADDPEAADPEAADREDRPKRRPGRTSVPSWDDIVLGTRTRDPQDG
jgi:hypothetical protein